MTAGLADTRPRAVVEAVVGMCAAMDLVVVAEGVEEPEQARALAALGVARGQGWLWSRAGRAAPRGGLGRGGGAGRVGGAGGAGARSGRPARARPGSRRGGCGRARR